MDYSRNFYYQEIDFKTETSSVISAEILNKENIIIEANSVT